jgi:hypothetical protein
MVHLSTSEIRLQKSPLTFLRIMLALGILLCDKHYCLTACTLSIFVMFKINIQDYEHTTKNIQRADFRRPTGIG